MKFSGLAKNIINYSFAIFLQKGLSLIILPLITRILLPEEYAIYSLFLLFIALASLIYQIGLQQSLMTYYHDCENKITLISTTYITIVIIGLFFSGLIIGFRSSLTKLIIDSEASIINTHLMIWSAIIIFFDVFNGITIVLLNIRQESKKYSFLAMTKTSIFLILLLFFTLIKRIDLFLIFKILVFATIISFLQSSYYLIGIVKKLQSKSNVYFSFSLLRKLLHFGLYMVPGTFAILLLQSIDRYMLKFLSSRNLYDVAIYSAAYKIGMILSLLTAVFDLVFFPYILKKSKSDRVKFDLKKIFTFYTIIGTLFSATIILFSSEFFLLLDPRYSEGAKIVFVGVISVFLRGAFNIIVLGFYIQKQSKYIAIMLFLGAFVNVLSNFILIPRFGVFGAGLASIFAYLFIVVLCLILVERKFPVGYKFKYLVVGLTILSLFSYLNYIFSFSISLFMIKLSVTLIVVAFLIIYFKRSEKYQQLINILLRSK